VHRQLKDGRGYQAILALNGMGKVIAAIFVAEKG
jgi:hypothetical protein